MFKEELVLFKNRLSLFKTKINDNKDVVALKLQMAGLVIIIGSTMISFFNSIEQALVENDFFVKELWIALLISVAGFLIQKLLYDTVDSIRGNEYEAEELGYDLYLALILIPVQEEVIFRATIFPAISAIFGMEIALIFDVFIFSLAHVLTIGSEYDRIDRLILFVGHVVSSSSSLVYFRTQNILLAILAHVIHNILCTLELKYRIKKER